MYITRRKTTQIKVGNVKIGGDAPISVQSMTVPSARDVEGNVEQIRQLELAGCELVRVAVPDMESADDGPVITPSALVRTCERMNVRYTPEG